MNKQPLPELLNGWQPIIANPQRGASNRQTDIFKAVIRQRRRLKSGETIEAGNLAQAMDRNKRLDPCANRVGVRSPGVAPQRLGVQFRIRPVFSDQWPTSRQ